MAFVCVGGGEAREETREKLRIVKTVLEQGGQFSGINRKASVFPSVSSSLLAAVMPLWWISVLPGPQAIAYGGERHSEHILLCVLWGWGGGA
jgi:hypothetical protein